MPTKFGVHDAKVYVQVNGEWKEIENVKEYHEIIVVPQKNPISKLWKAFKDRRNSRLCRHRKGAE